MVTSALTAIFGALMDDLFDPTVKDPYGHDYPVCTTLQWDFKPSQNSVTLTVEAPKTDVTSSASDEEATVTQGDESTTGTVPPPKAPEQLQQ